MSKDDQRAMRAPTVSQDAARRSGEKINAFVSRAIESATQQQPAPADESAGVAGGEIKELRGILLYRRERVKFGQSGFYCMGDADVDERAATLIARLERERDEAYTAIIERNGTIAEWEEEALQLEAEREILWGFVPSGELQAAQAQIEALRRTGEGG